MEREGWVYDIRGIKRGERFVGGGLTLEGSLVVVLLALVAGRHLEAWHERQPWKVGVVRFRSDGAWGLDRTVHKERLVEGVRLEQRIAELVAERAFAGNS